MAAATPVSRVETGEPGGLPRGHGGFMVHEALATEVTLGPHLGRRQCQLVVEQRDVLGRAAQLDDVETR